MNIFKRTYALIVAVSLVLAGCMAIPTPETASQRIAAAESTYKSVVLTIRDLAKRNLIPDEAKPGLAAALQAARFSLNAWHLAPNDEENRNNTLIALETLQALLDALTKQLEPATPTAPAVPSKFAYIPILRSTVAEPGISG